MAINNSTKEVDAPRSRFIDGKWQCKNLAFLVEFMQAAHLSTTKMAEITGYTRQSIVFWLNSDNASLKKLVNVFTKLGYKLEMELVKETAVRPTHNTFITLAAPENESGMNLNTCVRLMFLVKAMAKYNFNIMDITRKTGMTRTAVAHWFNADDILIGNIFNVAEAFGLTLNTTISPIDNSSV